MKILFWDDFRKKEQCFLEAINTKIVHQWMSTYPEIQL